MPRAVPRIGAFLEQVLFGFRSTVEYELIRTRSHQNPLLHHPELDLKNLLQVFVA